MKFVFFNDTGREVSIHPATESHGTKCDMTVIKPLEERIFCLPPNTYPWTKMWDYGQEKGLSILVSPRDDILHCDETEIFTDKKNPETNGKSIKKSNKGFDTKGNTNAKITTVPEFESTKRLREKNQKLIRDLKGY